MPISHYENIQRFLQHRKGKSGTCRTHWNCKALQNTGALLIHHDTDLVGWLPDHKDVDWYVNPYWNCSQSTNEILSTIRALCAQAGLSVPGDPSYTANSVIKDPGERAAEAKRIADQIRENKREERRFQYQLSKWKRDHCPEHVFRFQYFPHENPDPKIVCFKCQCIEAMARGERRDARKARKLNAL
jgi:hypothetical protein